MILNFFRMGRHSYKQQIDSVISSSLAIRFLSLAQNSGCKLDCLIPEFLESLQVPLEVNLNVVPKMLTLSFSDANKRFSVVRSMS